MTAHLFMDGRQYHPTLEFETDGLRMTLDEEDVTLGEIAITGKFIERLILNQGGKGGATVLIDTPGPTVLAPVGAYESCFVYVNAGEPLGRLWSYGSGVNPPLFVSAVVPAKLAVGGPLQNRLDVRRSWGRLTFMCEVVGIRGEVYEESYADREHVPTFTVSRNGEMVFSGTTDFRRAACPWRVPLAVFGDLRIVAHNDLGHLGPSESAPAVYHWYLLWNLYPVIPWVALVLLIAYTRRSCPRGWVVLIPTLASCALTFGASWIAPVRSTILPLDYDEAVQCLTLFAITLPGSCCLATSWHPYFLPKRANGLQRSSSSPD